MKTIKQYITESANPIRLTDDIAKQLSSMGFRKMTRQDEMSYQGVMHGLIYDNGKFTHVAGVDEEGQFQYMLEFGQDMGVIAIGDATAVIKALKRNGNMDKIEDTFSVEMEIDSYIGENPGKNATKLLKEAEGIFSKIFKTANVEIQST